MGQAKPHRPFALVVEDEFEQRVVLATLFEESNMEVIECESAEAAQAVLGQLGERIWLLFTDVNLAGNMSGIELAEFARARYPAMTIVVTSGKDQRIIPRDTWFMPKPWRALDVLIAAEQSLAAHGP